MHVVSKITISVLLLYLLTGCWGIKEIQNQTYAIAVGLDYVDGEYVIIIQSIGFGSVAKVEGGGQDPDAPVLILGRGAGKSLVEAVGDLEQSSQTALNYQHIKTIYLSPAILKHDIVALNDYLSHSVFIRYGTWFFIIEEAMDEVLLKNDFFTRSPTYTFTYDPEDLLRTNSFIPVTTYQNYIRKFDEPVGSILIPSIKLDEKSWKDPNGEHPVPAVDGAYFISNQQLQGKLSKDQLKGLDWFDERTKNLYLSVNPDGEQQLSIKISAPKISIDVLDGETPKYNLRLKIKASIIQNPSSLPIHEIKNRVDEELTKDLYLSYMEGLAIGIDLYSLSEKAYRFHNKWSKSKLNQLNEHSLNNVMVETQILNEGVLK